MNKVRLLSLIVCVCLAGASPSALASWDQEPANWDSGFDTFDRVPIWDHEFASWIDQSFTNGYSHMIFTFNQCWSGGFINDLQSFDNVVISTASDYNCLAIYEASVNPPGWDDYGSRWLNFVGGNDPGDTLKAAHDTAAEFSPTDYPQYYSSPGALGDTLKLSGNGETARHAVLYTGVWYSPEERAYVTTAVEIMFNTLVGDYGYSPGNIDILFGNEPTAISTPGAVTSTAYSADLQATLQTTGAELDADGQFFFWMYGHGFYADDVPEPATMGLLGLGGLSLLRKRQK